jgi:hypothetical protein
MAPDEKLLSGGRKLHVVAEPLPELVCPEFPANGGLG